MKKLLITCLVLSISIASLYSQNKTIKGRAITEDLENLPYMLIVINDTVKVGKTDLNGFFQIDIPISVKKILFTYIGMETAAITLEDTCGEIEIIMMFDTIYDFITLKKIDRHRKKRFKKLPKLRKEAFERSIFKTVKACYKQEFISYYEKKQK